MNSMSSIRSVLIKTSMSNIQKEISQLEHWLNNLPPSVDTPSINTPGIDTNLHQIMNRISEQTYNQELILKNIIERLDIIEGFRTSNREIFIDNQDNWIVKLYDEKNNRSINKNEIINTYNKYNYKTIFIGDGLSDFKVMGNVDYLFCKKNSLLHTKCIDDKCKHIVFTNFNDILEFIINLVNT